MQPAVLLCAAAMGWSCEFFCNEFLCDLPECADCGIEHNCGDSNEQAPKPPPSPPLPPSDTPAPPPTKEARPMGCEEWCGEKHTCDHPQCATCPDDVFEVTCPKATAGCAEWCDRHTCDLHDCRECGGERGCGARGPPCEKWCNAYTCEFAQCLGCGYPPNPAKGCQRASPPPLPPRAPWQGRCGKRYEACFQWPNCCLDEADGCFKRTGRQFAMCKPKPIGVCTSDDKWECPGWSGPMKFPPPNPPPKPPLPKPPPPSPSPPSPPPAPLRPPWAAKCSPSWQRCYDWPYCCLSEGDGCYRRAGKQFAMCRPLPKDGPCVDSDMWECPGWEPPVNTPSAAPPPATERLQPPLVTSGPAVATRPMMWPPPAPRKVVVPHAALANAQTQRPGIDGATVLGAAAADGSPAADGAFGLPQRAVTLIIIGTALLVAGSVLALVVLRLRRMQPSVRSAADMEDDDDQQQASRTKSAGRSRYEGMSTVEIPEGADEGYEREDEGEEEQLAPEDEDVEEAQEPPPPPPDDELEIDWVAKAAADDWAPKKPDVPGNMD